MANQRNQNQSQGSQSQKGNPGRFADDESEQGEELQGTTEEGVEISASLDDDETSLSADSEDSDGEGARGGERGGERGGNRGSGGQRGGSGNFANDRERASEAGRKGGKH